MNKIFLTISFLFFFGQKTHAKLLQSDVKTFSSWQTTREAFAKDCKNEGDLSQSSVDPKTMAGATIINRRQAYIPTTLAFPAKLDPSVKNKLEAIDQLAKAKAIEILKVSKKLPLEIAEKSTGLGLTLDTGLTPEDFLIKFDYQKACDCLHNTKNIVQDKSEYEKLSAEEFLVRDEHNKVKCFTDNAQI